MGHTWATALLAGGLDVNVYESNTANIEANTERVRKYLQRIAEKGTLQADDAVQAMQRLQFVESEEALAHCGAQALLGTHASLVCISTIPGSADGSSAWAVGTITAIRPANRREVSNFIVDCPV